MTFLDLLPYKKSIWLYPNGFSFVDQSDTALRQQHYAYADGYDLKGQAESFFNLSASEAVDLSVVAAVDVPAIVPADFQGDKDPLKMLELLVDKTQVAETFQWTEGSDSWIYFIRKNEKEALDSLNQRCQYVSVFELIQKYLQEMTAAEDVLWVSDGDGFVDFYARKNNKVALVNRFNYQQAEDKLYILLNVMQQSGLDKGTLVCFYSLDGQSSLLPLAQKYVENLKVIE